MDKVAEYGIYYCSDCDNYIIGELSENQYMECGCGEHMPKISLAELLTRLEALSTLSYTKDKVIDQLQKQNKQFARFIVHHNKKWDHIAQEYRCTRCNMLFGKNHKACTIASAAKVLED